MTFIVIFISLLIERFFDWSHLRRWQGLITFQHAVLKRFKNVSPYLTLAVTILPLLIVVGIINMIVANWLYGFIQLIFHLIVVLYCLGPKNFWANAFASINALVQGDTAGDKQSLHRQLLNQLFVAANRRVFAIVFWYFILGVVGAVLYRAVSLSSTDSEQETVTELAPSARVIETVLDWLPVRVFTFLFALAGHFVQVLTCWRKLVLLGLSSNETMLTECGIAALGGEEGQLAEDGSVEKSAISLLDRVFVIVLIIIAIFVLLL